VRVGGAITYPHLDKNSARVKREEEMQKRTFSREFKLDLTRQITSGQKRYSEVCREYGIAESILSRWLREYREHGESAFLPKKSEPKKSEKNTQEYLERKRAWDRSSYQRHKIKRQAAAAERKYRLYEYLQRIKAQARCKYCGENHPAALQFHHRDPKEKEFDVSTFVYHQKGGLKKLEAEIAKCDVLCANCHLKYHYDNDQKRLRGLVESVIDQVEKAEQLSIPTEEEIAHAVYNNYFPEGTDTDYLTDELYDNLEQ
jgi:transposase-like protein